MRRIDLLCLASSYKPGGRCVAGVDLSTGEWIRPVSAKESGTIPYPVFRLDGPRRAIRPLDQVAMTLDSARPEPEQPENWLIAPEDWQLTDQWTLAEAEDVLDDVTSTRNKLFGTPGNGLSVDEIPERGVKESLVVVRADSPTFYVNRRLSGSKQLRALFNLGPHHYDLPVSDMEPWADSLRSADRRQDWPGVWRFTCSLAGRWNGTCYKLIAAGFEPDG